MREIKVTYVNYIPVLYSIKPEETLNYVFQYHNFRRKYNLDCFRREYIEDALKDFLRRHLTKEKILNEILCLVNLLNRAKFTIELNSSGIFIIRLTSAIEEDFDNALIEEIVQKTHLRFHLNHLFCVVRDIIHRHQYLSYERGFPFLLHDSEGDIDLPKIAEDFIAHFEVQIENTARNLMDSIDRWERNWRGILDNLFEYSFNLRLIYSESNKLIATIRRREWSFVYFLKFLNLVTKEFQQTNLSRLRESLYNFKGLSESRRVAIESLSETISYGFGAGAFSLALSGAFISIYLGRGMIHSGSFKSLNIILSISLLLLIIFFGLRAILSLLKIRSNARLHIQVEVIE